jgi:uncharacterized protein YdhG (YjbR/CyaY superfamily)
MTAPKTIDEYLAPLPPKQRAALQALRNTIRKAAPHAEERISYQLPTFAQDGPLVAFGAWKEHCALYGLSGDLVGSFAKELAGFETSKGTIRFTPEKPLPAALVARLVATKLAANAARAAARKAKKGRPRAQPAAKSAARRAPSAPPRRNPEVETFLRALAHPAKAEIAAVREAILAVDPAVREEIKWNAPSFATREHFATFHTRAKQGFLLVLHRGAKSRTPAKRLAIPDPEGLLEWRANDRALVAFRDAMDVARKLPALRALLREWIREL